jgi:POLQ-like helicase
MKPEVNSRRLFGITRSKGKMYELGIPEQSHIAVPARDKPESLFLLTLATLGDAAAAINESANKPSEYDHSAVVELQFSASFFDAFIASRFNQTITRDVLLIASASYYLARRPGSSLVLARRLDDVAEDPPVERLLHWILKADWSEYPQVTHPIFGDRLVEFARLIAFHFYDGSGLDEIRTLISEIRDRAYVDASARDLLFVDIITAIATMRVTDSAWTTLPRFSQLPMELWSSIIRQSGFPKELWPSQLLLGEAGFFMGDSGVIQMPTSAGKTRSVELIVRSSFLAGRSNIAVVVAPFRALCHELSSSLSRAFKPEGIRVNEFSDVLQNDFLEQFEDFVNVATSQRKSILVLTPEKLLYVLRQLPTLTGQIGVVIYDEGHQFDSGSRGITYELLLTEIKALIPDGAQTVLVSAVMPNADSVGHWLNGESTKLVQGAALLPTARAVAFTSWIDQLGQLMFYESNTYKQSDYFVPRAIERQQLQRRSAREKVRYFPDRGSSSEASDVALYLGIRLARQGAVAIFCGRKSSASNIAARAVEIFKRGYAQPPPAELANSHELAKLKRLINEHFGQASEAAAAAALGIFVHHGNTPQGLRLAVEYGMQQGLINFVVCTSTLAQGVNLPIRYLIVSGVYQGLEKIKVRDFQNLMGRAGRAGMHTEGLVIFADPKVFDKRFSRRESWRFANSVELLSAEKTESTTSALLAVLSPFKSQDGAELIIPVAQLCQLLLAPESSWAAWASEVVRGNLAFRFDSQDIVNEIRRRRYLLHSVESSLMANRGSSAFSEFRAAVERLATNTLAYFLASDDQKIALRTLFELIADYVQSLAPSQERQAIYAKTLLGIDNATQVEQWVTDNKAALATKITNRDWLGAIWPLFESQCDDKFFRSVLPVGLSMELANQWMQGKCYGDLCGYARSQNGSKPWGSDRRRLTDDDIIDFCENKLGYDAALIVGAVGQFMEAGQLIEIDGLEAFRMFQKSISYGLPDASSIAAVDYGFHDRVIAQHLSILLKKQDNADSVEEGLKNHIGPIRELLSQYPSYFASVLEGRA